MVRARPLQICNNDRSGSDSLGSEKIGCTGTRCGQTQHQQEQVVEVQIQRQRARDGLAAGERASLCGVNIVIDQALPIERPFAGCFANGCMAEYEAGPELIDQFKHGRDLKLEAWDKAISPMTVTVPLVVFSDAYDAPLQEPKVFETSI
jgi:invasion protein IalB